MKYLQYDRLNQEGVDTALLDFLTTVTDPNTVARARNAFPEYFSWDKPAPQCIPCITYATRLVKLEYTGEEVFEAVSWFGGEVVTFETKPEKPNPTDTLVLPDTFQVERTDEYKGLFGDKPWWFEYEDSQYLALEVITKGVLQNDGVFIRALHEKYVCE